MLYNDSTVERYERELKQVIDLLKEGTLRNELALAHSLSTRWGSVAERDEAMVKLHMRYKKKKTDVSPEEADLLRLYKVRGSSSPIIITDAHLVHPPV